MNAILAHNVDKTALTFDILPYSANHVTLVVCEKDKGGTGSTGTAMSITELLLWLSVQVHIVDLADTQLDLQVPYARVTGVTIHRPERDAMGEDGCVLRAITSAAPGDVVIVQYPGSSMARIERLHRLLVHTKSRTALAVDTAIIWTMDSDRNSRDLLELTLDTPLPGTLHVNWPAWNGDVQIETALRAKIAAQGGRIFSLPALDDYFYRSFKSDRMAPRTTYVAGDFVARMQLDLWLHTVAEAVGAHW